LIIVPQIQAISFFIDIVVITCLPRLKFNLDILSLSIDIKEKLKIFPFGKNKSDDMLDFNQNNTFSSCII
jgi:hypothetical protein